MLDLSGKKHQLVFGKDGVIIQKFIAGIKGGRALVVEESAYPLSVIPAGHPVITKDGVYKPFPIVAKTNEGTPVVDEDGNQVYELGTLPTGFAYAGILYKSVLASKPAASVMTIGQVNIAALQFDMSGILSAFKAACPHIEFIKDEEAL